MAKKEKEKETVKEIVKEKKDSSKEKKTSKLELSDILKEIEKKAYEIYQDRIKKGTSGNDIEDWFAAEKIIKKKHDL